MEFSSNGDTPEFREWSSALEREFELWNTYAVLDAALLGVVCTWNVSSVWTEGGSNVEVTLSNGTKLGDKNQTWVISSAMNLDTIHNYPSILTNSVFSAQRYNPSDSSEFDPRKSLSLSEDTINAYLLNVSISALSLNTWRSPTSVNVTDYRTTYHFSAPMNLVLPYALSIVFALVFVVVGIWALVLNGVPVVHGGFLQIMTATRGRTEMERVVVEQCVKGNIIPKELLDLEIRYGVLVDGDGVNIGREGFGTVEETTPLKRG